MPTLIGLDYGYDATGMATWRDGRLYCTAIPTDPQWTRDRRAHVILSRIVAQLDPGGWEATLVAIEGRIKPHNESALMTALDLAELRGAINHALHVKGISEGGHRVDVHPATLKVYATGDGHASKRSMILAANGRLGHLTPPVANDDQADALWVLAMMTDYLGMPLVPMPVRNRAAVKRVTWPPAFDRFMVEKARRM